MQRTGIAPPPSGSLGRGASGRTRRALGAVLAVLLTAAVVAVVVVERDPAAFRDRAALPSCGSATGEAGDAGPPPAAAACLDAALRGARGAELRVVAFTTEGDPVTSYYRALPGGGVEVLVDSTQDEFGTGGWSRRSCRAPVSLRALGECEVAGL